MDWTALVIFVAVVVVFIFLKRSGQIAEKDARTHLQNGALVIDVRTPGEFNSGHLPGAINLPLDQIETSLPRRVTDKDTPLLLHCQSGMRSGAAKKKLNAMGYAKAFNLGSYGRAARIAGGN
jgi:phage shock protein E